MKYEVIDNFLDKKYFDDLVTLCTDKNKEGNAALHWYFQSNVSYPKFPIKNCNFFIRHKKEDEEKLFYMTHLFYYKNMPMSPFYDELLPLLDKLGTECLIRIKANLYPNTKTLHEHQMHKDYEFSHSTALLSLNTCDGYTKLKDGTKIDSVANRILLFDSNEEHCSTTTTNVPARFNININYFQEQIKEQKKSAKTQTLDHSGRSDSPNNE